jgi:hypothetical protein
MKFGGSMDLFHTAVLRKYKNESASFASIQNKKDISTSLLLGQKMVNSYATATLRN